MSLGILNSNCSDEHTVSTLNIFLTLGFDAAVEILFGGEGALYHDLK